MHDPLGIANRNVWLLLRPYVIIAAFYVLLVSGFGLFANIVALCVMYQFLDAIACAAGMLFLLTAGGITLVVLCLDNGMEQIYFEVHC